MVTKISTACSAPTMLKGSQPACLFCSASQAWETVGAYQSITHSVLATLVIIPLGAASGMLSHDPVSGEKILSQSGIVIINQEKRGMACGEGGGERAESEMRRPLTELSEHPTMGQAWGHRDTLWGTLHGSLGPRQSASSATAATHWSCYRTLGHVLLVLGQHMQTSCCSSRHAG